MLFSRIPWLLLIAVVIQCNGCSNTAGPEKNDPPEDNRFTKTVLSDDLNEPMELAVADDGRVFFTERSGGLYVYNPAEQKTKLLYRFPAKAVDKYLNGLIGITLDPAFKSNNQFYVFYSSATGGQYHQNVSRFTLTASGAFDSSTEKIIIKIPIDLEVSAHTGGSLAWDKENNLYISTGDNTVPFESDGYAPIDERKGRLVYDAQRSAGNTNDLRGKILRIHPNPDGTYSIPKGNMFPPGTPGTKPEIYVMGCRNPYRISVDIPTSILYWGEVGPDAGRDSRHGPRGYDEINQARNPGNYGWPYFVGNNQAYHDSNFASTAVGEIFNIRGAVNNSPNNTGMETVPAPRGAMLWYPYDSSAEFPSLANGGRCAMSGPVYHFNESLASSGKMPAYYNGSLFIYDWMRNWVFAVRFDDKQHFEKLEPFMRSNGDFRRPVDLEIGPDGVMYMLEYGSVYGIDNADARLVKITYNGGNRAPKARVSVSDTTGSLPFKISLNAGSSIDLDGDKLSYEWFVDGNNISSAPQTQYSFPEKGIHKIVLKANDGKLSSTDTINIIAGNTRPSITVRQQTNRSFYFEDETPFSYRVDVSDKEDKIMDEQNLKVSMKFVPKIDRSQKLVGHQQNPGISFGASLIASSDCKACHQLNAKAVGPAFMEVSKKYGNDRNMVGKLAAKIISGGGGVWGEHAMNAHPQLSTEDASEIVKYILALHENENEQLLPRQDSLQLKQHIGNKGEGRYIFTASYTDKGNGVTPLRTTEIITLRSALVEAEHADSISAPDMRRDSGLAMSDGSFFVLKDIDLSGISHISLHTKGTGLLELHKGSPMGELLAVLNPALRRVPVKDPGGINDLYFVLREANSTLLPDWIRFERGRLPARKERPGTIAGNLNSDHLKRGLELMMNSDCTSCHTTSEKLIGPSYNDIAKRYSGDNAMARKLADKIIAGGNGSWGTVPMTPHKEFTTNDAMLMVKYILRYTD